MEFAGRLLVFGALTWLLGACVPADDRNRPDDACDSDSDCGQGEICNPGSLRCVPEVTVGEAECAGSFQYIVSQSGAGYVNVYAKAKWKGEEYEICDFIQLADYDLWQTYSVYGWVEGEEDTSLVIPLNVISDLVKVGKNVSISDWLDPAAEGGAWASLIKVGIGDVALQRALADLSGGSIMFTHYDRGIGGQVAAEFESRLRTPAGCTVIRNGRAVCRDDEFVDPDTGMCRPAFDGYDAMLALDCVYNGQRDPGEGCVDGAYRLAGEEQAALYGGHCPAWDDGNNVAFFAYWFRSEGGPCRAIAAQVPRAQLVAGRSFTLTNEAPLAVYTCIADQGTVTIDSVLTQLTSGTLKIRYVKEAPGGRLFMSVVGSE